MSEPKILKLGEIIETENGNYIKFDSGTLIQFGIKVLSNISINTDFYGSCKRSPEGMQLGNYPIDFVDAPSISLNVSYSGIWLTEVNWLNKNTELPRITLLGPSGINISNGNFTIRWLAIGRWK